MPTGVVKFYRADKGGYGFIVADAGGPDVFMHASALQRAGLDSVQAGARIAYDTRQDKFKNGLFAINVRLLDQAAA